MKPIRDISEEDRKWLNQDVKGLNIAQRFLNGPKLTFLG